MRSLIARQGGDPTVAPSMREIPLEENDAAFEFAEKLLAGRIDAVLFLTGVGAQALLDALKLRHDETVVLAALDRAFVAVRGPKPTAVLKKWGVHIDVKAPEPNTWRETAAAIRAAVDLHGKTVAVQEYGKPNPELIEGLERRGAIVTRVPVYRWALPEDTGPLRGAIEEIAAGRIGAVLFTSAQQAVHMLDVAAEMGREAGLRAALAERTVVGSIGPTTSETLREHALPVDLEPEHPKMGPLVAAVASGWRGTGKARPDRSTA